MSLRPLWGQVAPEDVWIYVQSDWGPPGPVHLPVSYVDDICAFCNCLIPDTGTDCCNWCTWDLTSAQYWEYQALICAREEEVFTALGLLAT